MRSRGAGWPFWHRSTWWLLNPSNEKYLKISVNWRLTYPLKNMSSSDWIIIPTLGENKIHVPNQQPLKISVGSAFSGTPGNDVQRSSRSSRYLLPRFPKLRPKLGDFPSNLPPSCVNCCSRFRFDVLCLGPATHGNDQALVLFGEVWLPGLVNIQKPMENHHVQWDNPLFLW